MMLQSFSLAGVEHILLTYCIQIKPQRHVCVCLDSGGELKFNSKVNKTNETFSDPISITLDHLQKSKFSNIHTSTATKKINNVH